jgi:hypothetical protein
MIAQRHQILELFQRRQIGCHKSILSINNRSVSNLCV